jgi:broad specificity phosphatase PhoE
MNVAALLRESVDNVLEERLRSPAQRAHVTAAILAGVASLPKRPVPDLNVHMQKLEARVQRMAESVSLGFVSGRLVVKVAGSSEMLLKELRHGSDWYAPWEKVDETLLAAILSEPAK